MAWIVVVLVGLIVSLVLVGFVLAWPPGAKSRSWLLSEEATGSAVNARASAESGTSMTSTKKA